MNLVRDEKLPLQVLDLDLEGDLLVVDRETVGMWGNLEFWNKMLLLLNRH